jgi:FkbM family methyltransferase
MALYHQLEQNEIDIVNYLYQSNKNENLTVFDVGANRGLFIDLFLNKFKNIKIHSFEPITSLFDNLSLKYKDNQNVILNKLGISDDEKVLEFCELINPVTDGCSSLIERPVFKEMGWEYKKYEIPTISIDKYCLDNNISYVDFIKIDVEGAEMMVLKGCEQLFQNNSINLIHFEYGNTFQDAGITLYDVKTFIEKYEYNIYYFEDNKFNKIDDVNIKQYSKISIVNFVIKK